VFFRGYIAFQGTRMKGHRVAAEKRRPRREIKGNKAEIIAAVPFFTLLPKISL
jgi:hypothetical protein